MSNTHFSLKQTVEDEDKHSLEGVEYGKEIGQHDGFAIDE